MSTTSKMLIGRALFRLCDRWPALRPWLARWGLRTRAPWFEGQCPVAYSRRTGRRVRLASFSQSYLSFQLFWRGLDYYEPITTALAANLGRSTPLFVDVGANVGFYSLMQAAAHPDLEIVAFEPHPHLHRLLAANLAANGFSRVTPESMALSDREGVAPFYLSMSHMSASLDPNFDSNHDRVVSVPVTTLDAYIARRASPVPRRFLIKVDIEGHEAAFFAGARETLKRYQPDIIAECAAPYTEETIDLLHKCGYRFRQITDEGLVPCASPSGYLREPFAFLNCLFSTRPTPELDALSEQLRADTRALDLRRSSKVAGPETVERLKVVAKENRLRHPQGSRTSLAGAWGAG